MARLVRLRSGRVRSPVQGKAGRNTGIVGRAQLEGRMFCVAFLSVGLKALPPLTQKSGASTRALPPGLLASERRLGALAALASRAEARPLQNAFLACA